MKNLFLLLLITTFLSGCERDDDTMPPITQTGAGTFACYVNGKLFKDKSSPPHAMYELFEGKYYFSIGGEIKKTINDLWVIHIRTENKIVSENETLPLIEWQEGNASGGGGFRIPNFYGPVLTDSEYTGELTITKLDFEKQIVSGTFWFDLQHPVTGERIEIRQGRFDTTFAKTFFDPPL